MKRNYKYTRFYSILFLIIVAIFVMGANPFKGETIAPMDLLKNSLGWQNVDMNTEDIHPARTDILDSKLPHWINAKESILKNEIPLWNYTSTGGAPELFLFTSSLWTPAFFTFLSLDNNALGFYYSNLLNLLIGLIGMFYFLNLFFNKYASIFGAITFMFSGFNAAWFFWPHVNTSIWIPWVWFFVYKYINMKEWKYLPFITLSMLFLNLGGFPIVAVMGYLGLGMLVLFSLLENKISFKENLTILLNLILFASLSILIALPALYPLIEMFSHIGGIGYRHGGGNLKLSELVMFVNPYLYARPLVERTVYVGILPVLFLFMSIFLYQRKKYNKLIFKFSLALFIVSLTITYALIGPDILNLIPILNTNHWNRFSLLVAISLSLLAAYAIDYIMHRIKKEYIAILFAIAIILVQIVDQKMLFNRFNNVVSNQSFYPQTNSLNAIKKQINPFEYVVADTGFLISGTLGAYGINEWFSHNFRSAKEKKILENIVSRPFRTPTSARFECDQINFKSKYMDYLNVKYILCSKEYNKVPVRPLIADQPYLAPPIPKNKLLQPINVGKDITIHGFEIYMATYQYKKINSDIKLTLWQDKNQIASAIAPKEEIHDNRGANYDFDNAIVLKEGNYSISLEAVSPSISLPVTVWCGKSKEQPTLEVNGKKSNLVMLLNFLQEFQLPLKYRVYNLEPNISLIENSSVKGSAYFLSDLTNNSRIMYENIKLKIQNNSRIDIEYLGDKTGWIVIPMRIYPGWKAYVNGNEIQVDKMLGMLPAFRVKSPSHIIYRYEPDYLLWTLLISFLSLGFLVIYVFYKRKKG